MTKLFYELRLYENVFITLTLTAPRGTWQRVRTQPVHHPALVARLITVCLAPGLALLGGVLYHSRSGVNTINIHKTVLRLILVVFLFTLTEIRLIS